MKSIRYAAVAAALLAQGLHGASPKWSEEVDLAQRKVYVSTNATVPEIEAAKLLMRAQRMIAGGTDAADLHPEVAETLPKEGIVIGWQKSALLENMAKDLGLKDWRESECLGDAIVQKKKGGLYVFAGNAPECAYFSVADALYRNGARFIHTGTPEDGFTSGTYLEWMTALKAPADRFYEPRVARRTGMALRKWDDKVKSTDENLIAMNQFAVRNCVTPEGPLNGGRARGGIGTEGIQPPVGLFHKHPEWFPLVDGKRWKPAAGGWITEGCWSEPTFADWVLQNELGWFARRGKYDMVTDLNLTNSDGGPRCECGKCKEYRAQFPDIASWYWDYQAKLSKRINEAIPGLYNYTFAYINSRSFPKAGKKAVEHLDAIMYCPYSRCYVHPYSVKDCKTNRIDMDRAEEWRKAEIPIGDFDYCYDVFQPSMGMPSWEIVWDVVRYWKELNGEMRIPSIYMEAATIPHGCGGKSRISAYASARAMWDGAEAPAQVHLEDFCRVGFGDAAPEMLAWYEKASKAWMGQNAHLTSTFNNPLGTSKTYFTEELVKEGEAAFKSAEAKIRVRLAPEGTPIEKMTRDQNLARKQLATLMWEKAWSFDAWKKLRERALSSSMEINVEKGDPSDKEFDRMPPIQFATGHSWMPERTKTSARIYRTDDALRIRTTSLNPDFLPVEKAQQKTPDDDMGYQGNHLEIFLQKEGASDYLHLAVNANSLRYDALCLDNSFTSDKWLVDIKQDKAFLEFTVTIPWELVGESPKPGDRFKLLLVTLSRYAGDGQNPWTGAGLPRIAYHDLAVGADLIIDGNSGRRAGGDQ